MSNRSPMPSPLESNQVEELKEEVKEPVKQASSGIKVVALRAGFWNQMRKVEGDEFEVPSMEKLGSWMKCMDPKVEMLHQKYLKDKKKPVAGK